MDQEIPLTKGHNFVRTVENEQIYLNPESGDKPSYTIIFAHGIGQEGELFEDLFLSKERSVLPDSDIPIRVILPNAVRRPVSVYKDEVMRSWYNLISYDATTDTLVRDNDQIAESTAKLQDLIHKEARELYGGDYSKIIMSGFSQGSSMTWNVSLRLQQNIGAAIGIGSPVWESIYKWIPSQEGEAWMQLKKDSLPIFALNGTADKLVSYEKSQHIYEDIMVKELGFKNVTFITEEGGEHKVSDKVRAEIRNFLSTILK
ncbi:hypothetical protein FGO68_gene8431 [Halteria grandinella]|uniref:Phospholipase/carboxylesterase/thioesterase domain-containing protein n=1 Tax=Halteria grandinella TaxID=5974 RepID=A0A8J8NK03_HALGN|nr:hypothetical protein FGO68_gene8431 [Halteria grandinella]